METISHMLAAADLLIAAERPEVAIELLEDVLSGGNDITLRMKLARAYMLAGDETKAREILRRTVLETNDVRVTFLIAAEIPYCRPIVVERLNVVYYNVPKCGSSTFKDAIVLTLGEPRRPRRLHDSTAQFARTLSFDDIDRNYQSYASVLIVRHPRERLRSYWRRNIVHMHSLQNEAKGRDAFYGLSTRPSYNDMLCQFDRYRAVFIDFRHHTDSIVGFAGPDHRRIRHVFDLADIASAISLLGSEGQRLAADIVNMKSPDISYGEDHDLALEEKVVSHFYTNELAEYFDEAGNPRR